MSIKKRKQNKTELNINKSLSVQHEVLPLEILNRDIFPDPIDIPIEMLTDEQLHELGRDMIKWVLTPAPAGQRKVHLSEYYVGIRGISPIDWLLLRYNKVFRHYMEKALALMGIAMLKDKEFLFGYGNRLLSYYFRDIRTHEYEIAEEAAKLAAKAKRELEDSNPPNQDVLISLLDSVKEVKGPPYTCKSDRIYAESLNIEADIVDIGKSKD